MLDGLTERGDCALACLLAIKIAILSQCQHALGGGGTHCWMVRFPSPVGRVRVTEIRSNVLDYAILPCYSQPAEDATLYIVHPRRAVNQFHQLIDTSNYPCIA